MNSMPGKRQGGRSIGSTRRSISHSSQQGEIQDNGDRTTSILEALLRSVPPRITLPPGTEIEGRCPSVAFPTASGSIDTLELYRWAVQDPETHADVLRTMYERLRPGRQPVLLREDFAGTSAESVAWVALKRGRRAIAIDLDHATIEWAHRRAVRLLGARASEVQFVHDDVRKVGPPEVPPADIISVLNYSIFYQHTLEDLRFYLQRALAGLAPDGILVFNVFGGAERVQPGTTRRWVTPNPRLPTEPPVPEFEYAWAVQSYDPASRRLDCRIHFAVHSTGNPGAPGQIREVRDAFRYDFRVWSLSELLGECAQAGFTDAQVWRHTYDPLKGENGVFLGRVEPDSLSAVENWNAYIIACR